MIGTSPASAADNFAPGRPQKYRGAGQAAGFVAVRQVFDAIARQRGVGGDHAVETMPAQGIGNRRDLRVVEIGRNLQRHRHVLAVLIGQLLLARFSCASRSSSASSFCSSRRFLVFGDEMLTVT
jgi:hypothetical protein